MLPNQPIKASNIFKYNIKTKTNKKKQTKTYKIEGQ